MQWNLLFHGKRGSGAGGLPQRKERPLRRIAP